VRNAFIPDYQEGLARIGGVCPPVPPPDHSWPPYLEEIGAGWIDAQTDGEKAVLLGPPEGGDDWEPVTTGEWMNYSQGSSFTFKRNVGLSVASHCPVGICHWQVECECTDDDKVAMVFVGTAEKYEFRVDPSHVSFLALPPALRALVTEKPVFQSNSTIEKTWIEENDDAQDAWCGSDYGEPARHWPNFHPVTYHSSEQKCEEISYDDLQGGTIPNLPPMHAGKIWFWFSDHITSLTYDYCSGGPLITKTVQITPGNLSVTIPLVDPA
jgi:hypothetical protein